MVSIPFVASIKTWDCNVSKLSIVPAITPVSASTLALITGFRLILLVSGAKTTEASTSKSNKKV